jgi:hypothetical protein
MNNLLNGILGRPWANDKATLHTLTTWQLLRLFLVFSLPRGRKRRKPYASFASYPSNHAVWGGGCSWLDSPLFSVFANAWAGSGSRGQPLHMTTYTILRPTLYVPRNFYPNSSPNSHLHKIVGSFLDSRSSSSPSLLFLQPPTSNSPMTLILLYYSISLQGQILQYS